MLIFSMAEQCSKASYTLSYVLWTLQRRGHLCFCDFLKSCFRVQNTAGAPREPCWRPKKTKTAKIWRIFLKCPANMLEHICALIWPCTSLFNTYTDGWKPYLWVPDSPHNVAQKKDMTCWLHTKKARTLPLKKGMTCGYTKKSTYMRPDFAQKKSTDMRMTFALF